MADILLSYERTDRQRVAPIVALLEAHGWSVRWEPSADTGEVAERESAAADCIVAAWSIDSVDSAPVLAVASHGLARGILISVSIDFSRPPRDLEQAPSLALAGWTGDASSPRAQELLAAVGEVLAAAPAQPAVQPAAGLDGNARPAVEQPAELAVHPEAEAASEPRSQPVLEVDAEPEWQPALATEADPEPESQPALALEANPEREFQREAEADLGSADLMPHLAREEEEAAQPVWVFPDEPEEEDRTRPRLPPVLLRERVQHPIPPDAPPVSLARRSAAVAVGIVAGLAILGAGSLLWMTGWPGGGSTPDSEVAAVEVAPKTTPKAAVTPPSPSQPQETKPREAKLPDAKPQEPKPREARPHEAKPQEVKPQEMAPTPAALPQDKALEIEDLLGQVTPRVEELLANARRLLRSGDIGGARKVLAAPETDHSGSLTFLLAETYDPNILPAALKGTMASAERARALYRKARDLGDGRAQDRLDALKTSGWVPAASPRVAYPG